MRPRNEFTFALLQHWFVYCLSCLIFLLNACGTQEAPTRRSVVITGDIEKDTGGGLAGVTVSELITSNSAKSVSNGSFSFTTVPIPGMNGQLLVEYQGALQSFDLPGVPNEAEVEVNITYLTKSNLFQLSSYQVTDLTETNELPDPSPSPSPPFPQPTQTHGSKPTPSVTPTQTGPFDDKGNTTAFGIPKGITGNIGRGKTKNGKNCSICHGELGKGLNFSALKKRIAEAPMFLKIPDQDLADILAYLNRSQR
jgi:hypothetical protein